ncbi:MAG: hypothetical protein J7641_16170 [Cyanobacteria bacterium SID2]|nr:hypothetical protein [Cyanobacteria bacterium SID2]MBP0005983.1 hypothetical protein [Cyanobacteria bacterium SBC]
MKPSQAYVRKYLTFAATGFLGLACFNFIVDPQHLFRAVKIDQFNREKYQVSEPVLRTVKSLDLEQGNYDTLILGTSRTHNGIDPSHPVFDGSSAYNAALEGSHIFEIRDVLRFAIEHQSLTTVVLGLDMGSFSVGWTHGEDFSKSRFSDRNVYLTYLDRLISRQTTIDSLKTIAKNVLDYEQDIIKTDRGFKQRKPRSIDARQLFRKELNYSLADISEIDSSKPAFSKETLNALRDIIIACRENDIELHLFISPVHARQLEKMQSLGLFADFEQWKREVVAIVDEDRSAHPEKNIISVLDFSGYNSFTTEAVPPENSSEQMRWYLEASHYKKDLGDIVLDVVLNDTARSKEIPEDFGIAIDRDNIETHLAQIRSDRERYRQNYPDEVEEVAQAVRNALGQPFDETVRVPSSPTPSIR